MCYVRSIYSLFSPTPICTEIVVAVLLLFFSSSPSCFLSKAKFLHGSCTLRGFSENTPSDWMCFCLRSALPPHSCVPLPSFGELNPTVTVRSVSCAWDETCSPENSRDNNSQRTRRPCWSRRCGHASLPESFLKFLPFALPLSCSQGHLIPAQILSSKTINNNND